MSKIINLEKRASEIKQRLISKTQEFVRETQNESQPLYLAIIYYMVKEWKLPSGSAEMSHDIFDGDDPASQTWEC